MAAVAALVGDPARASMLAAMLYGRALDLWPTRSEQALNGARDPPNPSRESPKAETCRLISQA
jgi:hypothetical protein